MAISIQMNDIEPSYFICIENQFTGIYLMKNLVFN